MKKIIENIKNLIPSRELRRLNTMVRTLERMSKDEQTRALNYLFDRFQ